MGQNTNLYFIANHNVSCQDTDFCVIVSRDIWYRWIELHYNHFRKCLNLMGKIKADEEQIYATIKQTFTQESK